MYTLIAQNKYGEQLELTHNSAYEITSIEGIDPPEATINATHNATFDGSEFNSSYTNDRVITITMAINSPAEANRINLYHYFKSKFPVRLFYKNGVRDVYIDGYVKRMPISFFAKKQIAQIVIECPKPYFNGVNADTQSFSNVEAAFEFPFAIDEGGIPFSALIQNLEKTIINSGDVETGAVINITAAGNVVNPKIYNTGTGEHLFIDEEMASGDEIVVNTIKGQKSILLYPNGGGSQNIIGSLVEGSTWLQLIPGDNTFTITADSGAEYLEIYFTIVNQYEGV